MHILFTDETNVQPSENAKFFIYGGLFFPIDKLCLLHDGIEQIRIDAGYKPEDKLKFDTRVRPESVSMSAATTAKRLVVELCLSIGCKFTSYIILHEILKNQDHDKRILYGVNTVLQAYNKYLNGINDDGICALDNLPVRSESQFLSEKFTIGLDHSNGRKIKLDRIKLLSTTTINASHAASAMDIVLGSFRYCVNNPKNKVVAHGMLLNVVQMMWHDRIGDTFYLAEKGVIVRPKNIRVPAYQEEYTKLFDNLNALLAEAEDTEVAA